MGKLMSSLMMLWTTLAGEKKLLFALCEVRRAEHPAPIGVLARVDNLLKAGNCVRVPLRDFAALKTLYGTDWSMVHRKIFQYRKRNVYAMLFGNWNELVDTMRSYLAKKNIPYDFQSFPTGYKRPFSIMGKTAFGRTVRCYFVYVDAIDSFLKKSCSATGNPSFLEISRSTSGSVRVVPN